MRLGIERKMYSWWVYALIGIGVCLLAGLGVFGAGWRIVITFAAFWFGVNTGIELYKRNHGR